MTATAVTLRPKFPMELTSKLWTWLNSPRHHNFDDYGPKTYPEFLKVFAERSTKERTWAVIVGGEVVGYLGFAPQSTIAGAIHGLVISPSYRGNGIGTAALNEAVSQLIAEGFKSITSTIFADNAVIHHVLRSVGFDDVGVLRKAAMKDGKMVSMQIMQYVEGD